MILVLTGTPGSGKSTFAEALESRANGNWVRINQDTLGNRKKCEQATYQALSEAKHVIIDRTNVDKGQRGHWLRIARYGLIWKEKKGGRKKRKEKKKKEKKSKHAAF